MNVTVVAHTHDAKTDQGAHVERQDGNEQRLHTFQVTVEEDGHEHNLQGGQKVILNPVTVVECSSEGKRVRGPDLGHHIRDGGGAYDHAVLVLEKNPGMNPRLKKNKTKQNKGKESTAASLIKMSRTLKQEMHSHFPSAYTLDTKTLD